MIIMAIIDIYIIIIIIFVIIIMMMILAIIINYTKIRANLQRNFCN